MQRTDQKTQLNYYYFREYFQILTKLHFSLIIYYCLECHIPGKTSSEFLETGKFYNISNNT